MNMKFLEELFKPVGGTARFSTLSVFLDLILPAVYFIAGVLLLAMCIISGFKIMTGSGKNLEDVKKMLKSGIIGLVIVAAAAVVTALVARAFGLDPGEVGL